MYKIVVIWVKIHSQTKNYRMKKVILFLILAIFFALAIKGQNDTKPPVKIIGGVVFDTSGTTCFSDWKRPFTLGNNLSPNVCVITKKTYHNFLYGFGNNAARNVNGYFLNTKKDLGTYLALGKSLSLRGGYIAIEIEKMVKAGDVNCFLFSEIQSNINHGSQTKDFQLNIGVHVNIQTLIYSKRTSQ